MNYRHIYHAGNFADVFKHIILSRIIVYLQRKDTPFRILDTHAGIGLYNLTNELSIKTQEWFYGVKKFLPELPKLSEAELNILRPWLDVITSINNTDELTMYPGSPLISRKLLRKQDRLSAIELHPHDVLKLKKLFAGDYQTKVIHLDGWLALNSQLPPKEKRGIILIDPPFEQKNEFDVIVERVKQALSKFRHGVYAIWYPIKHYNLVEKFIKNMQQLDLPETLVLEICRERSSDTPTLDGCGMMVINPPYVLEQEIKVISPLLEKQLSDNGARKVTIRRLNNGKK